MSKTIISSTTRDPVRQRYEEALASFVERVQQDRYIIAALLYGSLAYDRVWERSDIDILLITKEKKLHTKFFLLVENGVCFSVHMDTRSKFKEMIEQSLQGAFIHSVLTTSKLLFSSDDSIRDYFENVQHVGSHDRQYQLLRATAHVLPALMKAEKWLVVKKDPTYSFLWLMYVINYLAQIEVIWNGGIAAREVIYQALRYNPEFFNAIYTNLVHQPKDETIVRTAIQRINDYMDEKVLVLCKPILDYLAEAEGSRSLTEINEHIGKRVGFEGDVTCEWLAHKGIISRVSSPTRLTEKSQVTMDEAAYYYDGDE